MPSWQFITSTSASLNQVVNKASTTTSLTPGSTRVSASIIPPERGTAAARITGGARPPLERLLRLPRQSRYAYRHMLESLP